MAVKTIQPYYQEFKKVLNNKLEEIRSKIEPETAGQLFQNLSPEATFLKEIVEGVTRHPFRYYQKEAIYTLHAIYKHAIDLCNASESIQKNLLRQKSYEHIGPLLEIVDDEHSRLAPFLGFEMATGSGKTMLMGASVYYLNKMHNVRNFLIITPSSTEIYKKTIRNFQKGTKETVWDDNVPFKFNLITGDNYKHSKDLFSADCDANIFVFNIDKFGSKATLTKKEWESSIWKDKNGNTISLLDFLSQNDLIIITDEAHHAQSVPAKAIIKSFKPIAILEYTATAIETEKNESKKNQTIVYKYDIKRFLEDKYGKKVRVLALPGEELKIKGKKTEILDIEKYKLLTFFLVHLLKKKALSIDPKCRDIKPIGFIKVKNEISFSEKVETYIKSELALDKSSLQLILDKARLEDTETTNLIWEMFEQDYNADITKIQHAIGVVASTAILLHSKADKLVKKQFDDIYKNNVEIVIFIDMLNEGIDMPNIYSMVVINDTPSEFKTSVKQIVGRGVRLNKLRREYDDVEDNDLITHTEKLHIICDKGASFEEVVMQIQREFGLTDKTFAIERGKEEVIENQVKSDKLRGIRIPRIKIDFKRKAGANIQAVIQNYSNIIKDYIESNSFSREVNNEIFNFLKYAPNNFFTEIDLFTDEKAFHKLGEELNWHFDPLLVTDVDMKEIYGRVISKLKAIPDVPQTYKTFLHYGELLNEAGLFFYNLDSVDFKLAINRFKDSFTYFYIHYIENEYFELDLNTLDSGSNTWLLENEFKTVNIKVRTKDKGNNDRKNKVDKELIELIKSGYYFFGYENSAYDYDKFDSLPEKQLADYINHLIEQEASKTDPFWVRNERNIYFEYGTHKYFPDFIFFYNKIIYVIEIKGEAFSSVKKNHLLLELNNVNGIGKVDSYVGMVVFEVQMKKLKDFTKAFNEFRAEAEEYFNQVESISEVVSEDSITDFQKFKEYIPAYDDKQAYNKFLAYKISKSTKWLKVKPGSYEKTVFATLIKNDSLGFENKNKWLLFDSAPQTVESIEGLFVLCYHPSINDESYSKGLTIRCFNTETFTDKIGMFDETFKKIILSGDSLDNIELTALSSFKVIGVLK